MIVKTVYSSQLSDIGIRNLFRKCKIDKKLTCSNCGSNLLIGFDQRSYRCKKCWNRVSITAGTWIGSSRMSLRFWYEIIWCFVLSHSANKASRLLETEYKSVWSAYQTIRKAIYLESKLRKKKITGTIELDESFFGGTFKNLRKSIRMEFRRLGLNKRGGGAKYRKQPVFGIFKRNGEVYLESIPESTAKVLVPIIRKRIRLSSRVFSDTATPYAGLVGLGYIHKTVDHGKEEYVDGEIHINGLEGFWGLSKTNMHTYKGIKKKNWLLYLKEMEFRYNNRRVEFYEMAAKIIGILISYRKEVFVRS